jgi:prophage regulatory protein
MKSLRIPTVIALRGCSKSHTFNDIENGLFPKPVKIGAKLSIWPVYEVDVTNAAWVAGWDKGRIRRLVTELHALRKHTPGMTDDEINAAVAKIASRVRGSSPTASGKAA